MSDLPILIFDVNETLLDLDTLAPHFERMFGRRAAMREWFAQLILYSQALTLAGDYIPFGALGGAVLTMLGAIHGKRITEDDLAQVKAAIAAMPPHGDVAPALAKLRDAGFRMATLTNNPRDTCIAQLERARLMPFFEQNFSIDDTVKRYKPAPETYRAVEQALGVAPRRLCLIACHTWDTLGAAAAGWVSALILRPDNAALPAGPQPDIIGADLHEIAAALLAMYK